MQSATSFFNRALFRKNLQRFWPLWLGYVLIWLLLLPLPLKLLLLLKKNLNLTLFSTTQALRKSKLSKLSENSPVLVLWKLKTWLTKLQAKLKKLSAKKLLLKS